MELDTLLHEIKKAAEKHNVQCELTHSSDNPCVIRRQELSPCPMCDEGSARVTFIGESGPTFDCSHCQNESFYDLAGKIGVRLPARRFKPVDNFKQFIEAHNPFKRRKIIKGFLYERDNMNVVGGSKTNKSILLSQTILQICGGKLWLGKYETRYPGPILYFDYELQKDSIVERFTQQAKALGLPDEVFDKFTVHSMRGEDYMPIDEACRWLAEIPYQSYGLVIFDSLSRGFPKGFNENDNAGMTELYNWLDIAAEKQGCAFINVHHTSKGAQADKKTADIGSGAGAQSRATDCHLALVEHAKREHVVMRSIVRACPPQDPIVLRREWPLWHHAPEENPEDTTKGTYLTVEELANLVPEDGIGKTLFKNTKHSGCNKTEACKLLEEAINLGLVEEYKEGKGSNKPVLIKRVKTNG